MASVKNSQTSSAPPARALYPYEYEIAWEIHTFGPMAAADFAGGGRWRDDTAQTMANRMRALVRRGVLTMPEPGSGIYHLSELMRAAMSW